MDQPAKIEATRNILSHLPLFQALSGEQLAAVTHGTREIRTGKGEVLFRRGSPCTGVHAVVYGQVKLSVSSPQGQEKVVEIIGPRQCFGEAVMFLDRPYPVTAETLADSLVLHVSRAAIDELLAGDPTFARAMLAGLSFRLHSLIRDVESYSMRSSMQRVIGYLLLQCGDEANAAEITLPTSKLVIASRLNLTPETLSRILADLSHQQLIAVEGRTIHIADVARLRGHEG